MASGQNVVSITWDEAIDDFASVDAHSSSMDRTIFFDLSDHVNGRVVKKSLRAFLSLMTRQPVDFLHDDICEDEFIHLPG